MSLIESFLKEGAVQGTGKEVFIAIRIDGAIGSGTVEDPYNGATHTFLDDLLANRNGTRTSITENMTIRFGPGIFQTKGFGNISALGWQPFSGQRLIGSGIHQTTLQLVKAQGFSDSGSFQGVISTNANVSDIEISDMTLDANLARQPKALDGKFALTRADGVNFYNSGGTRIVIRRIRVINWGTHTPLTAPGTHEGFPLYIASGGGGATGETIIEDCIVEQPDLWPAREVTLLDSSAASGSPELFSTVRNNYVNGDFTTGSPPPAILVLKIVDSSPTITFTTKWPHRLQTGAYVDDWVYITGASSNPAYNGRHKVTVADDFCSFGIDKGTLGSVPTDSGITIQRYVPKAMVISSWSWDSSSPTVFTITTPIPHLRDATLSGGDYIRISGAKVNGDFSNLFNGSFKVVSTTSNTISVSIDSGATQGPDPDSVLWLDRWPSAAIPIHSVDGRTADKLITTSRAHYSVSGDYVLISGAGTGWDGYVAVSTVVNSRQFKISTSATNYAEPAAATIGRNFHGPGAPGGYGARVYGNRTVGINYGGPYHDTGAVIHDSVTRNNYYYLVDVGPFSVVDNYGTRELRAITEDNIIELRPKGAGILYWVNSTDYTTDDLAFGTLMIRGNIICFPIGIPSDAPYYGISVVRVEQAIVKNNLVLVPQGSYALVRHDTPAWDAYHPTVWKTFFNNLGLKGVHLQAVAYLLKGSGTPPVLQNIKQIDILAQKIIPPDSPALTPS